ncbi:AraC family transcriptional regulator [Cedecea neteri]|uniref:NADP-dependent 3-hydroxy acid dehydrogenase YdfG n=1 Tax=Cedecea neteri TaxID=158822 RepID=A0A089PWZ6_9ENTR|nr:SDR family oxidoreductase [Cedecea neteri]AIR03441.1 AraC family transcriptional regulator [Cedecea neteri]
MSNASKGTALVTGASGGIGAVYADRLAKRGYDLILVARNTDRLNQVAERLRQESGRSVQIVTADLGNATELLQLETRLKDDESISLLVNNAGFGSKESILEANVDEMTAMIDLNVTALTRLTYAAAPAMAARKHGTIINIASIVAIAPELLNGVYGASKAFVLALSHSLQHELTGSGVRVQAVLPGATATNFWNITGVGGHENLPQSWVMSTEDMVDASLAGLDAGEKVTIPALQEGSDWDNWEAERRAVSTRLSAAQPAPRYVR